MVPNAQKNNGTPVPPSTNDTTEMSGHWYSLVKWDEVPHWQQDNHHIHGSYRRPSGSYQRSFASLFRIHNETVNIYTHLIPGLAALPGSFALYTILQPRYVQATKTDVFAFSFFFLGAAACLSMSAIYHTISNHSPRVNKLGNQLDYVGIVLLISGSFVPSIYYGFWCNATLQKLYWAMVSRVWKLASQS
jgi:adiponectin receptor